LVRSKIEALYLSAKSSIIVACPFSAATCIGVRSVDTGVLIVNMRFSQ
jgi:hypothetical protein